MAGEWFCKITGKERGPLSPAQLKQLASRGELHRDDLVRQGTEGPWVPADRVKGLFSGSATKHALPVAKPLENGRSSPSSGKKPPPRPGPPPVQNGRSPPNFLVLGSHDAPTLPSIQISPPVPTVSKPLLKRRRGLRLHIAATAALAVVAIALVAVAFAMWRQEPPGPQTDSTPKQTQLASVSKPAAASATTPKPTATVRWHNAATATIELPDDQVAIKVRSARVTGLDARYAVREAGRRFLVVAVNLHNHGKTKKLDFETWGKLTQSSVGVSLGDEHGNRYKLVRVPGEQSQSIYPGKHYTDELVFEPPIDSAKTLRLVLPAAAIGGSGSLNFEIPRAMITTEPEPAKPSAPKSPQSAPTIPPSASP